MKKMLIFCALLSILVMSQDSYACVGKVIYIGITNSPDEQLLAEMLSVLINERTGTTVNVKYYKNSGDLYDAVKRKEIGMLVENTEHAMEMLGRHKEKDIKNAYAVAKKEYRKYFNLIWLEPFGFLSTDGKTGHYYLPVITADVSSNFPALPRVINKLGGIMDDEIFSRLIKTVKSGEKPRKTARDFLKSKKLI